MPKVRVVTPTDPKTDSIKAFHHRLTHGPCSQVTFDYRVYSAADNSDNLDDMAGYAVGDAPNVLVACGWMAAQALLNTGTSLPVVMAAGGYIPNSPPANLTGFKLNGTDVANHQLAHIQASDVTVLYDDTNDASIEIVNNLTAVSGKTVHLLPIHDRSKFAQQNVTTDGFLVIPNAMYYDHCAEIVAMVDNNASVRAIYYPEREYKAISGNQGKVKVYGHHIQNTFRKAADLVCTIVSPGFKISALPPVADADVDNDAGA